MVNLVKLVRVLNGLAVVLRICRRSDDIRCTPSPEVDHSDQSVRCPGRQLSIHGQSQPAPEFASTDLPRLLVIDTLYPSSKSACGNATCHLVPGIVPGQKANRLPSQLAGGFPRQSAVGQVALWMHHSLPRTSLWFGERNEIPVHSAISLPSQAEQSDWVHHVCFALRIGRRTDPLPGGIPRTVTAAGQTEDMSMVTGGGR